MTSTVSTTPDTPRLQRMRKALPRFLLLAAVVAGIVVAVLYRESIDSTALEAWITQFGPWAPVVFFCAYVLATVLFLPGLLFTLAAGALFGPYMGTLIALIGATVGATIAFLIARYVLAGWISARTPARVQRVIEGVEDEGWRFVAMTRLIPFIPFNALNYALGLTRIRLVSYVAASVVFMAPGAAAYAYLGHAGRSLATGGRGPGSERSARPRGPRPDRFHAPPHQALHEGPQGGAGAGGANGPGGGYSRRRAARIAVNTTIAPA